MPLAPGCDLRLKARDLGATLLQEVKETGEHGWISVIMDPTGAVIAMWKGRQSV